MTETCFELLVSQLERFDYYFVLYLCVMTIIIVQNVNCLHTDQLLNGSNSSFSYQWDFVEIKTVFVHTFEKLTRVLIFFNANVLKKNFDKVTIFPKEKTSVFLVLRIPHHWSAASNCNFRRC